MLATSVSDLNTTHRARRALPSTAVEEPPAPTALTVTVQIHLPGPHLPAAAEGLLESLRALAGTDGTVVGEVRTVDAEPHPVTPRTGSPRHRLVRRGGDPLAGGPSLRIYLASRMVLRDGMPVRLTRREYDLLVFLCEHPRRVFSRSQLLSQVWGYDMVSGERTVDVHVRRLRVKLGERGPVIATVRGVGYRLDDAAQVTVVSGTD